MKRCLLLFTLFCLQLVGSPPPVTLYIETAEAVNPYERLIKAIVEVECKGDYMALNPKELATGPFQIRPIRLRDFNQRTSSNYTLQDCFDYEISKKIFLYYALQFHYSDVRSIAIDWNKSVTDIYYLKVLAEL
jgi:hypothetical protein